MYHLCRRRSSLAEAKELAGAKWQPAWEEKFAEAKISRDEAVKCWKESEAKAADLGGALRKTPRHQPARAWRRRWTFRQS